jgi:hypothetical protein
MTRSARAVAGEDTGGESVVGVVGEAHGLVLILEAEHRQHGTEQLLLDGRKLRRRTLDDGRAVVPAAVQVGGPLAAMDEAAAGGHGLRHHVLYAVELPTRAERPHLRGGIERIADLDRLGALDDARQQRLAQLVLDDQA